MLYQSHNKIWLNYIHHYVKMCKYMYSTQNTSCVKSFEQ